MHAKITFYNGHLVLQLLAKASIEGEVTSSIDKPSNLGQVIHDSSKHLGVSQEALDAMKTVRHGHDSIGDIDWFKANDGKDYFAWIGGPNAIKKVDGMETARNFSLLSHVLIPNEVPDGAKEVID